MHLNVEEQKKNFIQLQFSNFYRVSNQNRLHLCHERLWFSGDVCILVIQRPQQLEKGFLSSQGHNPSQPLVTVSSLATLPSSPCISLGILLSDGVQWFAYVCVGLWDFKDAQLAQLASFPTLVRSRLDLSGEHRSRLSRPRWDAAALGGKARPRRGGCAAAEVRRLRGGDGRIRLETPELSQPQRRADAFYLPSTFVQVDPWILFLSLHDMMLLVSASVTRMIRWVACLVVLCLLDESAKAGLPGQISYFLNIISVRIAIAQWRMIDQSVWNRDKGLKMWC